VLQRRPNTFAQTILSLSFFACDKAADHTFLFARLHEAASAADAFACSKETIWEVPDFPDRRGLRKDRSCAIR
jgi:protein involved in temperature-dependent protein secretion